MIVSALYCAAAERWSALKVPLLVIVVCAMMQSTIYADGLSRDRAKDNKIVSWVDADGVTHFSDSQFAHPEDARVVSVDPTNAMDVPKTGYSTYTSASSGGPSVRFLTRGVKKNKRGWRGHARKQDRSRHRRR